MSVATVPALLPLSCRTFRIIALAACVSLMAVGGAAQKSGPYPASVGSPCGAVASLGAVAMHAPTPRSGIALCDARALPASASVGKGTPLALASSDFDEDGVPDLVSAFGGSSGGYVTIHRGNVAALWPYGDAVRDGIPAAFLPGPRTFTLPEAPDFVVAGDFDADGHVDIVSAQRGSSSLYFLKGDGHGGFAAAKRFAVAGVVTDLIAGDVNRPNGLAALVVAVTGAGGSAALVYQSPMGALKGAPETYPLSQPATALALGKFAGSALRDLAIGAGNQLVLVHGRDRNLSANNGTPVAPAVVTQQVMGYNIRSLASGDFTGRAPSIAALGDDGNVHILEHSVTAKALASLQGNSSSTPSFQAAGSGDGHATAASVGLIASSSQVRAAALRAMVAQSSSSAEWTEQSAIALPNGASSSAHALVAARMTGATQEDLLVVDSGNSQVHVLSAKAGQRELKAMAARTGAAVSSVARMSVMASLDATSAPVAVLPMRLSRNGLNGLVSLHAAAATPAVMPQDTPPASYYYVTNTLDITDVSQKNNPPAGSLRAAMEAVQSASSCNDVFTCTIVFNIPTTDAGYNAATGIYKIQPLSENVPGSLDDFALPPINNTVVIDGYTQPGASPNTLAFGDNAKIAIQIDGGKATTPGGSGFEPFDDVGTVIRGFALTGWTTPDIQSNGAAAGASGIEAEGIGDFFEGNFFGTADGKTSAPNRLGVFAVNGPLFGQGSGNVVGGTTPQARNIISGSSDVNMLFLDTSYEAQLQGNYVGLDITGVAALTGNGAEGVAMNGPTVTVGGTLAGTRNFISGNTLNIDINDLTNGGAATGSYIQGNYIGTDATGTKALSTDVTGVGIQHNPTNYLIGGTTPAARNIISGNQYGVTILDYAFYNMIQGNYIGTDPTGSIAVPNVLDGFYSGQTASKLYPPAGYTTIGGSVPGAGNVISGNTVDGIQINGTSATSPGYTPYIGNTIQGNFIGTDATGTLPLPNKGNGVSILLGGTNNTIGGTSGGLGNLIANNALNGVLIDPGTANGPGVGNNTIANIITSNQGAGVRIKSGTGNRISVNSIYNNASLGIDLDAAGPGTNSHCNATSNGANLLQNYPVLSAGTGSTYITATATDPNGNTSEFSKAVPATQVANLLSLLGSFDGLPNTTFTIEFFSSSTADASGYGQGKTYLGSTTITTDANCSGTIAKPVDVTQADVSVVLTLPGNYLQVGPDFGTHVYSGAIVNNGPATAHNVTFTDVLPSQLKVSSTYCNVGLCQSPFVTTQGTCSVSGQTITCNLGTLAAGATANVSIPVQALLPVSIANTVTVSATEVDPNLLNNSSTVTATATYPAALIDHLDPATVFANSPTTTLNIYGEGFTSDTTVKFNGTALPVAAIVDNQACTTGLNTDFCTDLQVSVPASMLTTAGTPVVEVTNPGSYVNDKSLTIVAGCTYFVDSGIGSSISNSGSNLIAPTVYVSTNVPSCAWTATSAVPWAQILDHASSTGSATVDVAFAPNTTTAARSGSITVAGQTLSFTQDAGSSSICSVGMPANLSEGAGAGTDSVAATLSGSNCAPFAVAYSDSTWLKIATNATLLLANGSMPFSFTANNGLPRTGSIVIGGNATTVTQAGPSCYFTLSAASALSPAGGGTGSFTVTATPSTCAWTATSSNTSQLSVTSGASGTGNGTVNYTVAPNAVGPQQPTITVGNTASTTTFTVNQASAIACTFTLSPTPVSVTANGYSNIFQVNASFPFCKWTATSNNPDSLDVTGGASGTGSGTVYYSVAQNTGAARTLTITAGCQSFTVNQDAVASTAPSLGLVSLQPATATAGGAAFTLTVNGTGFVSGSVVNFNGSPRATTYVSATQLTAAILASDIANSGTAPITVTNPAPNAGASNALTFTISAPIPPTPVLTALSPSSTAAGSGAFTLTVTGTNFVSGETLYFNGFARVTTYVSATQITAAILASDVVTAGSAQVTVAPPAPGVTSNALTFTISAANNPTPVLTTLSPSSTTAGSAGFAMTVTGTGFVSGATVTFNGSARAATYVSATQLTVAVLAGDVGTAGTASVVATNPTPGGGASNGLTFTINAANNPTPVLTALSPSSTTAGSGGFAMTVSGTGFVNGATVTFNGSARATTYVSATQLTVAVLAGDVGTAGTASVVATNPTPGGGASNALTFTINAANNPTPVLTALSPSSVTAGSSGFILTVTGTGFVSGAAVSINGSARATTYVSVTQLTVAVLASDVTTAGAATVTVTNPAPGGGASNSLSLTITAIATNPVPTISGLQPASINAGSGATTLTVNGTNFLSSSTVTVQGSARVTTYVSATQLTVGLLASDVASSGSDSIVVTNPAPGGGASNSASLTIATLVSSGFTVTSSTTPQTINPGGTALYSITVTAVNGSYANPVELAVTGLPVGAMATFTPASITPGSGAATSTLTIQAPKQMAMIQRTGSWTMLASAFPLCGFLFSKKRRRGLWLTLIAVCCVAGLTGCGGGFSLFGNHPQTYNIVVTGTYGATQQTTSIKLTVNF